METKPAWAVVPATNDSQAMRLAQPGLPKTIEEATRRYLHHYSRSFVGPAAEMLRLKSLTRAFILKLRKVAPKFYDEKLPQFVNQACSTLLTYDTSTHDGQLKFHQCHSAFLKILEILRQNQPAGEVSFTNERLRVMEREKLNKRYLELRAKIEELEAAEIDYEELGEDEYETAYEKLFNDLDQLKAELKRVSIEVAYIDGVKIEEDPHFELRVPPRSILNSLTKEQLANLEKQMFDLIKENKNKRTAMYVDKSIIDSMIEKLNIDPALFKKEQIRDITKDALDAYKAYFRDIDSKNREKFYDELLDRKSLMPREGIIIRNPDDVPDDVKIKLEENNRLCKREIEDILDNYSKRPCSEDHSGDQVEASDNEDDTEKIIETVKKRGIKYERVKEEPRDDCEEIPSGDEREVPSELAEALVDNRSITYVDPSQQAADDEDEFAEERKPDVKMEISGGSDGISNSYDESPEDDDDDDDIECLGTVEPTDKIQTLDIVE